MQVRDSLYIGGSWVSPASGEAIEVENPATEQPIGSVPAGTAADVDRAVSAAREAFATWSALTPAERVPYLQRLADGIAARSDEIARTIAEEMGAPLRIASKIQAGLPVSVSASMPQVVSEYDFEERIGNSLVVKEPIGVVGAITPWNYPLHQVVAKVAPALGAGCTVVLKPSEIAPLSSYLLAEVITEAGLPAGVVNIVTGYGPTVGEAIAAHPDIDMVSFTGSVRSGRRVSELAAGTVKKVALEMGGKSANVVLPDADLETAVKVGVGGCFLNSGQTCTALTRLLVHQDQYADAVEMAARNAERYTPGDPFDDKTRLGPVVSASQRDRVRGFINAGVGEGARLALGGAEPPQTPATGYYVQPTVFADVAPDMTIAQEEIFGPVLSVIGYRDDDEAVEIANNSTYGLAGSVWSGDQERAVSVARRIRTGQVDINGGSFNAGAPFGGFKHSGHGRELGRYGLEEFLAPKSLQL